MRQLLKSYVLENVHWNEKNDRYVMVVAILTRGDDDAKQWLWSVLPRVSARPESWTKQPRDSQECDDPRSVARSRNAPESSNVQLDYVPGESKQRGGLFFRSDPRSRELDVRALGYEEP